MSQAVDRRARRVAAAVALAAAASATACGAQPDRTTPITVYAASRFIAEVDSPTGKRILEENGFTEPLKNSKG